MNEFDRNLHDCLLSQRHSCLVCEVICENSVSSERYLAVIHEHAVMSNAHGRARVESLEPFAVPLRSRWRVSVPHAEHCLFLLWGERLDEDAFGQNVGS